MNWGSAQEFFAMGGYGAYVWGSYGVAAACIAAELWFLRGRRRTLEHSPGHNGGERGSDPSSGQP
jgi:heme exporter protein D